MDPIFKSLKLTSPTKLTVEASPLFAETWTNHATVPYEFPGTEYTVESTLPVTWYDGPNALPPRDRLGDVPTDYKLPGAGSVLVGEKGSMIIPHYAMPTLFPEQKFPANELAIIEGVNHYTQWADACVGKGETTSHFDYAGPLTEAVLLGTIGIRFPEQELVWDAKSLKITNHAQATVGEHRATFPCGRPTRCT